MPCVKTSNACSGERRTVTLALIGSVTGSSFLVGRVLEGAERIGPEALQVGAERGEPVGVDAVEMPGAVLALGHETRSLQDAEVLRDGRPADGERGRDVDDGARTVSKEFQDRPPGRVPQRVQHLGRVR